jgi:hypothetical protein
VKEALGVDTWADVGGEKRNWPALGGRGGSLAGNVEHIVSTNAQESGVRSVMSLLCRYSGNMKGCDDESISFQKWYL